MIGFAHILFKAAKWHRILPGWLPGADYFLCRPPIICGHSISVLAGQLKIRLLPPTCACSACCLGLVQGTSVSRILFRKCLWFGSDIFVIGLFYLFLVGGLFGVCLGILRGLFRYVYGFAQNILAICLGFVWGLSRVCLGVV